MYRILSLVVVMLALIYCIATPYIVESKISKCSYVTPQESTIQNIITATGVIEPINSREIFIPTAIIPSDVKFSVGDCVNKGNIIAEIDVKTTESVLRNSITATTNMLFPDNDSKKFVNSLLDKFGMDISNINDISSVFSQIKSIEKTVKTTIPNRITAPIDGVITKLSLNSGILCQPTGAAVRIDNLSKMKAVINISESDIAYVKVGQPVNIEGTGFPNQTIEGQVSKIYPCVTENNNGSNFIPVEVIINKTKCMLKPGFSVNASILIDSGVQACSLPYEVIKQDEENNEYVYIFEKGRAIKKYITTGTEMPEVIEITSGIVNDNVVLNTNESIYDGCLVIIDGDKNVN